MQAFPARETTWVAYVLCQPAHSAWLYDGTAATKSLTLARISISYPPAWPAGHQSFGAGLHKPPLLSPGATNFGGALVITKDASGAVTNVELEAGWID